MTVIDPKSADRSVNTSAKPSARKISVSDPSRRSKRAATSSQGAGEPPPWAERRSGSGDMLWRTGSLNGGLLSTISNEPGVRPAAANTSARAAMSRQQAVTRSPRPLRLAFSLASAVNAGSISTKVSERPETRIASANPAAPTPAPSSTPRSPALAATAAASRMASCPNRWPRRGCRSRSRPPRTASSLRSASARIRIELVAKACIREQPAGGRNAILMNQHPPGQHAERAFEHAHVLVEDDVRDIGLREHGFDRRDQHRVIGPHDLAHARLPFARARPHHDPQHQHDCETQRGGPEVHGSHREGSDVRPPVKPVTGPNCWYSCPVSIAFLCSLVPLAGRCVLAVVVPFEPHDHQSIDQLVRLVTPDMERVNACILS